MLGNEAGVTGLRVQVDAGRRHPRLSIHGLFVAIGHTPNTSLFEGQLAMNNGYIEIRRACPAARPKRPCAACSRPATSPTSDYRQAITSAGFGCMAALDAEKFLDKDA